MKKIIYVLLISLLFFMTFPTLETSANTNCDGISPYTKVYWDGIELKKGQIGRVTIESNTILYKLENNQFTPIRELKKGERYRVYTLRSGYYGVGAGLVVKKDVNVLYQTPSKYKLQQINCGENASNSVSLFKTKSYINNYLGQENNSYVNEFKLMTDVYHKAYKNLNMISYINDEAHLIYSKDLNFKYKSLKIGDSIDEVKKSLGPNYDKISNTYTEEILLYTFADHEAYIFIDIHKGKTISGFYLISKPMIAKNSTLYPIKTNDLQKSYESQLFIITNAERKLNNISTLTYSNAASLVARAHSKDMALNDYFSHTNLKGLSPFDRLSESGITYRTAGENIAVGYSNPIFAHEALMNSLGHRKNKLNANYTNLGTGVDYRSWNTGSTPYYAENYFTP